MSILSSANAFNLDQCKILSFGKELVLITPDVFHMVKSTGIRNTFFLYLHENTGHWFEPQARPILFPRIDDSCCHRIHSSLTAVRCFDSNNVIKQPVTWKEYCV